MMIKTWRKRKDEIWLRKNENRKKNLTQNSWAWGNQKLIPKGY